MRRSHLGRPHGPDADGERRRRVGDGGDHGATARHHDQPRNERDHAGERQRQRHEVLDRPELQLDLVRAGP